MSKELNRKPSYKLYKSPRIIKNSTSPDEYTDKQIYQKESTRQYKNYNYNISKTESNQNQYEKYSSKNTQQDKKGFYSSNSNTKIIKTNYPTEEKKSIKNSVSSRNCTIKNKKEEPIIYPLNRNKSNTRIITTSKDSGNQNINKYKNNTNEIQGLYYSNIDLNNKIKTNTINNDYKRPYQIAYTNIQKKNENENKYQYRPQSQTKSEKIKSETKLKYDNKALKNKQKLDLKQSQSLSHLKYNNNTNTSYKTKSIPISNDYSYTKKTTEKTEKNKNYNANSYITKTIEPRQHKVYISNTSSYNSKVNQDKNDNNSKINKYPILKQYYYKQPQQTNNNVSSIQSKYFRNDNKTSVLESYKMNTDNKIKNNNQKYYTSQTGKNQEKFGANNTKKTYDFLK